MLIGDGVRENAVLRTVFILKAYHINVITYGGRPRAPPSRKRLLGQILQSDRKRCAPPLRHLQPSEPLVNAVLSTWTQHAAKSPDHAISSRPARKVPPAPQRSTPPICSSPLILPTLDPARRAQKCSMRENTEFSTARPEGHRLRQHVATQTDQASVLGSSAPDPAHSRQ